jgi:hypothetical protein
MKPTSKSRGRGISVINDVSEVLKMLNDIITDHVRRASHPLEVLEDAIVIAGVQV